MLYVCVEGGDKDARDLREMVVERRLREGKEVSNQRRLGGFERHTKVGQLFTAKKIHC